MYHYHYHYNLELAQRDLARAGRVDDGEEPLNLLLAEARLVGEDDLLIGMFKSPLLGAPSL